MEAAPRLPMQSFPQLRSGKVIQFEKQLGAYIGASYHEDPNNYLTEFERLNQLRIRSVSAAQTVDTLAEMKRYYCQLSFLKSRFPMDHGQPCDITFEWLDFNKSLISGGVDFEMAALMYNIGALHTILGADESRTTPESMKLACSHFQCAVFAFQTVRSYDNVQSPFNAPELFTFYKEYCLAQAQECILEKSMLDNRKSTIIAKVAVQTWEFYRTAFGHLKSLREDIFGPIQTYKDWLKIVQFKIGYHRAVSLFFQGVQAEEMQKMGERVAFYQQAADSLTHAHNHLTVRQQKELAEALSFTADVIEGKKNAARKENEFIYHEDVPDLATCQELKGAPLVKGIAFDVNDIDVSGPDIFARLVPIEAHEAASVYSEKKAELLRTIARKLEAKDGELAEFVSSLQLTWLSQMNQASGVTQEVIDRAAALSARPDALQQLIDSMSELSHTYHDVEGNLEEIDVMLQEDNDSELTLQSVIGTKRAPSHIMTDLSREAGKYREAHTKAKESNETLSKAMMMHVENLQILQKPLRELQAVLPSIQLPDPNIDQVALKSLENLMQKIDEMRTQRAMLYAQIRDAVHSDDITSAVVTKSDNVTLDDIYTKGLSKHDGLVGVLEQNLAAQDNIKTALIETYAKSLNTRRYIQDIIQRRAVTIQALIASHDAYDDLLGKARKGIEFYRKLATNVHKLMTRIRSAARVQQEERDQLSMGSREDVATPSAPKLKDYLYPGIRPTPVGSELPQLLTDRFSQLQSSYTPKGYATHNTLGMDVQTYASQDQRAVTSTSQSYETVPGTAAAMSAEMMVVPGGSYYPQEFVSSVAQPNYLSYHSTYSSPGQTFTSVQAQDVPTSSQSGPYYRSGSGSYPATPQTGSGSYAAAPQTGSGSYAATPQTGSGSYAAAPQTGSGSYAATSQTGSGSYAATSQTGSGSYAATPQTGSGSYAATPQTGSGTYAATPQTGTGSSDQSQSYEATKSPYTGSYGSSYTGRTDPATGSYPAQNYQYTGSYATNTADNQIGYTGNSVSAPTGCDGAATTYQYTGSYNNYPTGIVTNTPPARNDNHQYSTGSGNDGTTNYQYTGSYNNYATGNVQNPTEYTGSASQPYTSSSTNTTSQYAGYSNAPQTGNDYLYYTGSGAAQSGNVPEVMHAPYAAAAAYYAMPAASNVPFSVTGSHQYPTAYGYQPTSGYHPHETTTTNHLDLLTGLDFASNIPTLTPQQHQPPEVAVNKLPVQPIRQVETSILPTTKVVVQPSQSLDNPHTVQLLRQEFERFDRFVDSLTVKSHLDVKWREVVDGQEESEKGTTIIAVARCYPSKNRYPDVLPYDRNRVVLTTVKDDYVNASWIDPTIPFAPPLIVTQHPLQATLPDFWTMVREQHVELIVCLLNDQELGDDLYWPLEKGRSVTWINHNLSATLQHHLETPDWSQRVVNVATLDRKDGHDVLICQFRQWRDSQFPPPGKFWNFVEEIFRTFQKQKQLAHPILVHCAAGAGRTGTFATLFTALLVVLNQDKFPDLTALAVTLSQSRRNLLRDREHLKFVYDCFLTYVKQHVPEINGQQSSDAALRVAEQSIETPTTDPFGDLDPLWACKKK